MEEEGTGAKDARRRLLKDIEEGRGAPWIRNGAAGGRGRVDTLD